MDKIRKKIWPALCCILCVAALLLPARATEALTPEEKMELDKAASAASAELRDADAPTLSDSTATSGTVGNSLKWSLDSNGLLTISGTGSMGRYYHYLDEPSPFDSDSRIRSVSISQGVTDIGASVFFGCANLTSVTIPDSVTSINFRAFSGCNGLKSIAIPDSVTLLENNAFENCHGLTDIVIPYRVTEIEEELFEYCDALKSVTIPEGVTSIGSSAFSGCKALTDVYYAGTESKWRAITVADYNDPLASATIHYSSTGGAKVVDSGTCGSSIKWTFDENGLLTVSGSGAMTDYSTGGYPDWWYSHRENVKSIRVERGVTHIGNWAFTNCVNATSATLPDTLTSIGGWAFHDCTNLKDVQIPESVTTLSKCVFCDCKSLESMTIPKSITILKNWLFYGCVSLKSVTMLGVVTEVEFSAFYNCKSLTDVYYAGSKTQWEAVKISESSNDALKSAAIHYNGGGDVATTYTVTFDAQGGTGAPATMTVTKGGTYDNLPYPTRAGYTYMGWFTERTGGTHVYNQTSVDTYGNVTLYAHWSGNSYTVTFNANGGSVSSSSKSVTNGATYGDLPTPTRDGYTFDGWYTSSSGGDKITSSSTVNITAGQTLYAHWTQNVVATYTVTFDAQGGTGAPDTMTVVSGKTYENLPTPTRAGYAYRGWFTERTGGTHVYNQTNVDIYGNVTLYAHWSGNSYTVTFNANGGSVSSSSKSVTNGETYGDLPTPTRSEYAFDGWYTASDGGSKIESSSTVNLTANQTLYAHWIQNVVTHTVIFDGNGGSVSPASMTVTNGKPYGDLPTPTRSGYQFDGWFTASDGGDKVTGDLSVNLSANQTLYAHWTKVIVTRTVIFDGNGGSVSPASKTVTNGETYGDLPAPTRDGYKFDGWFTASDSGLKITSSSTVNLSADTTLYAHWTELPKIPTLETLSYGFSNSRGGLGYPKPYHIPYERYVMIFGDTMFAKMRYLIDSAEDWAGNCFGFSSTTAMFSQSDSGVAVGDFKSDASAPAQLQPSDKSGKWNITVQQFLESMQVSQNDPAIQADINFNKNNLTALCQVVSNFQNTGKEPVLVAVFGKQGGHALLGYKLEKVSDTQSRLYVYDCNFPNQERYIALTTDTSGKYTGWSYRMNDVYDWGSAFKGSWISYVPYAHFYKVWNDRDRKSSMSMEALTVNADVVIRDFEGNPLASLEDGELTTMRADIYPVVRFGLTADGEAMQSDTSSVWIPVDIYSLKRTDDYVRVNGEATLMGEDAPFEASITHMNQSSDVSTTAEGFTFVVDDNSELNRVMFDKTVNSGTYNITFHSTLSGEEQEAQVKGDVMSHLMTFYMVNGVAEADPQSVGSIQSYTLNGAPMNIGMNMTADSAAYLVSFAANGGGGNMTPGKTENDGTFTFPACEFTPPEPGRTFVGWKLNDKIYQSGETVTLDSDATATAQWSSNVPAISDVAVNGNSVTVTLSSPIGSGLTVAVCAYSESNQMLRCAFGDTLSVSLDVSGASYLKAFLLDARTQCPVADFRKNL